VPCAGDMAQQQLGRCIDDHDAAGQGLHAAATGAGAGGGGGGPCFIATAAYDTPMSAEINVLRDVRDTYLLDNAAGTAFVDAYYHVSPAIADVVAQSPVLAAIIRVMLVPVIFLSKLALASPTLFGLMMLSMAAMVIVRRKRRLSR